MKNSTLFYIINGLLVLVVGLILGLTCSSYIFSNSTGICAFVCLLVTLCLPSLIYAFADNLKVGGLIATILFTVFEVVLNIVFICMPSLGLTPYWISQAIIIGAFLISSLLLVASNRKSVK